MNEPKASAARAMQIHWVRPGAILKEGRRSRWVLFGTIQNDVGRK